MNLIEVLKKANGKPITRQWWPNRDLVYTTKSEIQWAKRDEFTRDKNLLSTDNLLADDWYVVEPKSKIEEAIEREVKVFWNNEKAETMYSMDTKSMLRRVVNLALDEAKMAVSNYGDCGYGCVVSKAQERIDALKVKE